MSSLQNGIATISQALAPLRAGQPGVYRMLNSEGKALYVGKASDLKKRVASYTQITRLPIRLQRMVAQTATMEFLLTANEAEALLVEASLIKELRPHYNILLRDDKSYPYIRVDLEHPYPRISKYRGPRKGKAEYYGPYASAGAVNEALKILQRSFLLRPCKDSFFANRTRPCLQYHIKRCSAPCVGEISQSDYRHLIDLSRAFLNGDSLPIQAELREKMETASAAMEYEAAAALRDRLKALTDVQNMQRLSLGSIAHADAVALSRGGGLCCVQRFSFRHGQNLGNECFFFPDQEEEDGQLMESFLSQFYAAHPCPPELLLSVSPPEQTMLEAAFSLKEGRKTRLAVPQRGERRDAVDMALRNTREALQRKLAESASMNQYLAQMAELFGLSALPKRIEVYDNSHLMGSHTLGAMIVAGPEGFIKNAYRTFNRKDETLAPGDDYGMMREMLRRRFASLAKDPEAERPDLLLIDGGPGQLSAVVEVMAEADVSSIPVVAIAKGPDRNAGRETFYQPGRSPFQCSPNSPVLYHLQRLRDEAHRFAIGSHRQRRGKALTTSELDELPGIGPARKKALLHHFGSARAVRQASLADLAATPGINARTAQTIYDHFHPDR